MFSKLAVAFVASLAVFVAAAPASSGHDISDSCNTGDMYCCNTTYKPDTSEAKFLQKMGFVDVIASADLIGEDCKHMPLGLGSSSCTQQPVCCSGNDFQGLVVVGCSPVNIQL